MPPPRVASVPYLDELGLAAARLEQALGEVGGSPFAEAMKTGVAAADELADDVERRYKGRWAEALERAAGGAGADGSSPPSPMAVRER